MKGLFRFFFILAIIYVDTSKDMKNEKTSVRDKWSEFNTSNKNDLEGTIWSFNFVNVVRGRLVAFWRLLHRDRLSGPK